MSKAKKAVAQIRTTARRWDGLETPSVGALEQSRKIFAQEGRFLWSAASIESIPPPTMPEIAFLGCSNVGKSTLLNVLLGRKRHKIARTSSKPGRTQALNGFSVGKNFCLVDSPGYGYKSRDEWGSMIMKYLKSRSTLKRTCLLIEASHGYKNNDEELMQQLCRQGTPFQVVFTKIDKVGEQDFVELLKYSETYLKKIGKAAVWGEVLGVSSDERRLGVAELRASLLRVSNPLLLDQKSALHGEAKIDRDHVTSEESRNKTVRTTVGPLGG